jgi:hypothetical protein
MNSAEEDGHGARPQSFFESALSSNVGGLAPCRSLSAAQLHADALRESYRDPRPRVEEPKAAQTVRASRPRRLRALILARA